MRKRGVVAGAVGAVLVAGAAARGVVRRFEVRESSMAPTLMEGDWIIAKRATGTPDRGDIVAFPDPAATGRTLIKRVIGLGSERVGVDGGRVTIDGALLADRWAQGITEPDGEWSIPDDHVWVLGDNRGLSSSDSRMIGPVRVDAIGWIATARYWPTSRVGSIS